MSLSFEKIKFCIQAFFTTQFSGIALLTMLPFIISGIIFDPWDMEIINDLSVGSPYTYKAVPAGILLLLCLAVTVITRNMAYLMCVCSAGLLLCMALKHEQIFRIEWPEWSVFYILYTFTSIATFFIVALRPTISSWLFRSLMVVLCLDFLLSIIGSSFLILSPFFLAYFPSHSSIIICVLLIAFFRMLRKFHVENGPTRAQLKAVTEANPKFRKMVRYKMLSLWWPMLFVFLVFTLGYQMLQERYINQPLVAHLNALGTTEPVEIYEGQAPVRAPVAGIMPKTVENASKAAVTRLSQAQSDMIKDKIDGRLKKAGNDKDKVLEGVKDSMPKRFPGTKTKSCDFGDVNCFGANIAKRTINSAYLSAKRSMLADLEDRLDALEKSGKNSAQDFKDAVEASFLTFESQTNRHISNTATGMRYLNWAALIYALLILSKSMMIVFARVFYARISTAPAQKTEEELEGEQETQQKSKKGKMKRLKHKHTLTRDDGYQRYYINFRSCGNNVIDRRRIPQPFTLILKRMFARNYVMCQIDLAADKNVSACDIIVDPPAEIVMWDLEEQDEVFINMRSLIGFSDTCRLGRRISLSLGSLIFGRALYYSVKGPGRIFVRTASAPIAANDPDANNVMQASSLVAWRRDTTFNVISSLTKSDTFFSGYSIRKAGPQHHLVIYDTSQSCRVGAGQGIFKMARAFLVPF